MLRVISGEYRPSSGNISKRNDLVLGFLNQDLLSYLSEKSILDVAMEAFERANELHLEIEECLKALEHDYSDSLLDRLHKAQVEYENLDGYSLQHKAESILEGLGFSTADLSRPLKEFSGGWRMRVMLAKTLLRKPNLLLLDEPTNHLDLPSIQWLEEYLKQYEGTVVIVSHDRYFLDKIVNRIVEIEHQKSPFTLVIIQTILKKKPKDKNFKLISLKTRKNILKNKSDSSNDLKPKHQKQVRLNQE